MRGDGMNEADRVSKAEYARMRDVSNSYVSRLAKLGRIVIDDQGLVIVKMSDVLRAATRDPTRGGVNSGKQTTRESIKAPEIANGAAPSADAGSAVPAAWSPLVPIGTNGESMTLAEASRLEKVERTRKLRLEIAEQAGQLLRRDVVEAETFKRARQGQEALMSLKDRLTPLLATETDAHAIDALLDAEFRHVIAVLTGARDPLREAA